MEDVSVTTEQLTLQPVDYTKEQWHQILDYVAAEWLQGEQPQCGLYHTFTPGLYSRRIIMPQYSLMLSAWHKTEHQFVVSRGVVDVLNIEDMSVVRISAPYNGITPAGSRRLLFIHEETEWTTFHATDKKTHEEVEADILEPREIQSLITKAKENLQWHSQLLEQ